MQEAQKYQKTEFQTKLNYQKRRLQNHNLTFQNFILTLFSISENYEARDCYFGIFEFFQ